MIITIEKLVHGGAGLGVAEGKKIFVPFAAPGDVLDVEITADHGNWAEGTIARIVEPAPCRVEPPCPVFGRCGGCQWQHLSYEAQLEWKRLILAETLKRIAKIRDPEVGPALPSPAQWHYRNRIQLHVDSKGSVGFYRPKSKEVVEFAECAIADGRINLELNARRSEIAKRDRGIALKADSDAATDPGSASPSFAQINTGQNEQLKKVIVEWLENVPHRTVLELYAGAGNFTFAIAKLAEHIVASDVDKQAIVAARRRQQEEKVANVEFVCAPAARASRRLPEGCDAVLLDPPRKGCAEAVEAVAAASPASILYVSCDPATLARDILAFAGHGYRLVKALPVDMFPQTFHIEALTLLQQQA